MDDPVKPSLRDETVKPSLRDDTVKPPLREDTVKPSLRDDTVKPSLRDDTVKPSLRDEEAKPPLRLTLRIDHAGRHMLGPGKVRLLEMIGEHGSISAAGRAMGMSYRRAWLLVEAMNLTFASEVVAAKPGGSGGGGARLTAMGQEVVRRYRDIEAAAGAVAAAELAALLDALAPPIEASGP
jgi:molybdate transport system regulatory protein